MTQIPNQYLPTIVEQKIILNDGTELKARAGLSSSCLWIWLDEEMSFITAAMTFSDPSKTSKIHVVYSGMDEEDYEGYTLLASIEEDSGNHTLSICLKKNN